MSYFRNLFSTNQNCVMLQEFECYGCKAHFLTDLKGGALHCPSCGDLLNGAGAMVIAQKNCTHTVAQDRHEYRP